MISSWPLLLLLLAAPAAAKPPRLTLFITVDGFGSDLLLRTRPRLKAGLAQLLNQGAYFPTGRYDFAATCTAAGHATLATGANPWRHGVVENRGYDRTTGKLEPIFSDPSHPVLEAPASVDDVSPQNLLAETLSDRLKVATQGRGKSIALSQKARSSIAQAGRLGQAWWFSEEVGKFVTGTWYAKEFPAWLKAFNERKLPEKYFSQEWTLSAPSRDYLGDDDRPFESSVLGLGRTFPHPLRGGLPGPGPQSYSALSSSPFMGDVLVQAAKAAIDGEKLGQDEVPDLLSVSFSQVDRIEHLYGPYSWEMQDALLRLDVSIGQLLAIADKAAGGRANLLVVLTADHGSAAIPEEWAAAGLPASRVNPTAWQQSLGKELQTKFGSADLVVGFETANLSLNARVIAERKLDAPSVRRAAAQWLSRQPQIALAVARDDLWGPDSSPGLLSALQRGFHPDRGGDVLFVMRSFQVLTTESSGTNHGSPYSYDSHVPVVFAGKGIKPGLYRSELPVTDVAPTVAALMEIDAPAQSEGRVCAEALMSK